MPTNLDDQLLANLIAAGSTDVLVGLPTRNHERAVGSVVQTVLSTFAGPFVRERTVLLNVDAGSTDGTLQILRDLRTSNASALRSIHQITTEFAGLPTRDAVLKVVLTAADLLSARAVIILDPGAEQLTAADVERWVRSILEHGADYVKPVFARSVLDGPLVTQLLRPLLASTYGFELAEPVDTQMALSGRFSADSLKSEFWGSPTAEFGIDAFLSAYAMNGPHRLRQVATPSRGRLSASGAPSVSEAFEQLVGAVLSCLVHDVATWIAVDGLTPVPLDGHVEPTQGNGPTFHSGDLIDSFRLGVGALTPLLIGFLSPELLLALTEAAKSKKPHIDDELWASVVLAFVGAAVARKAPPLRLAQMLEPLYLGRLASLVLCQDAAHIDSVPDRLVHVFQNQKGALVSELRRGKEQ